MVRKVLNHELRAKNACMMRSSTAINPGLTVSLRQHRNDRLKDSTYKQSKSQVLRTLETVKSQKSPNEVEESSKTFDFAIEVKSLSHPKEFKTKMQVPRFVILQAKFTSNENSAQPTDRKPDMQEQIYQESRNNIQIIETKHGTGGSLNLKYDSPAKQYTSKASPIKSSQRKLLNHSSVQQLDFQQANSRMSKKYVKSSKLVLNQKDEELIPEGTLESISPGADESILHPSAIYNDEYEFRLGRFKTHVFSHNKESVVSSKKHTTRSSVTFNNSQPHMMMDKSSSQLETQTDAPYMVTITTKPVQQAQSSPQKKF